MASSITIVLLLIVVYTASYFGPASANFGPVAAVNLTGTVYCTTNGNPFFSCGLLSCPKAANATVILAVQRTNVVVATTTTDANGAFAFNVSLNATTAITLLQAFQLVAYVPLPVANCTSLSGAGILVGVLGEIITSFTPVIVGLNLIGFIRN